MLGKPGRIISHHDLKSKVNTLSKVLNQAYCLSCPIVRRNRKSKPPWWNVELGSQRRYLQEVFKQAKIAGREECWDEYKDMLKIYKSAIYIHCHTYSTDPSGISITFHRDARSLNDIPGLKRQSKHIFNMEQYYNNTITILTIQY